MVITKKQGKKDRFLFAIAQLIVRFNRSIESAMDSNAILLERLASTKGQHEWNWNHDYQVKLARG